MTRLPAPPEPRTTPAPRLCARCAAELPDPSTFDAAYFAANPGTLSYRRQLLPGDLAAGLALGVRSVSAPVPVVTVLRVEEGRHVAFLPQHLAVIHEGVTG